MDYKITQEQLQTIANYLASKPYSEVFQLIGLISNLEKIETEKPKGNDEKG